MHRRPLEKCGRMQQEPQPVPQEKTAQPASRGTGNQQDKSKERNKREDIQLRVLPGGEVIKQPVAFGPWCSEEQDDENGKKGSASKKKAARDVLAFSSCGPTPSVHIALAFLSAAFTGHCDCWMNHHTFVVACRTDDSSLERVSCSGTHISNYGGLNLEWVMTRRSSTGEPGLANSQTAWS